MFSALLAGALIAGSSLACGQAIMLIAGRRGFSPVAPAVGLSALLVVCGIAIKLPGHGSTAAVAATLATAAAGWVLVTRRRRLGIVEVGALVAVVGAVLVAAIPFLVNGRVGILGQGLVNDDMASHLLFTEWIDTHAGPTPDLIKDGYPLGPHAIVVATAKISGADLIEGFAGLTFALGALAALTAYGALRGVRSWLRPPASVLAALPYLGAAYFAQGAFKEPMLGLALLGFALYLPALVDVWDGLRPTLASTLPDRGRSWLRERALTVLPLGVIAAGTIYNYSFPGLAWLVVALAAWGLLIAWRERAKRHGLQLRSRLRWSRHALIAGVAIVLIAALPELLRLVSFSGFEAFNPSGEGGNTGFGNLRQALNPLEALGVWPSSEFRIAPANSSTPVIAFYLGGLLGLAAFAWGLVRSLARGESALPAALFAGGLGYLAAVLAGTPYTSAKALAIVAGIVMLVVLRGLFAAGPIDEEEPAPEEETWVPVRLRPLARLAIPLLAVAFVAAAALSTLLPLRQSAVGPRDNAEVLMRMRPVVGGQDVLFLGRDNFISWELLGSEVYTPILNHYDTEEIATNYRATPINAKFDWDNVPLDVPDDIDSKTLRDFDWVLTTSADFQSEPPPEFTAAVETKNFILWHRTAESGDRRTLSEQLYPGAEVDCSKTQHSALTAIPGVGTVFPVAPVIGKEWDPSPEVTDARGASQELTLPSGRWAISIQYASTQDLHVRAPGFDQTLQTNLLFRGPSPYYPVGEIDVSDAGPIRFDVTVDRPPLIGRVLGTESRAYLGSIAATPLSADQGGADPNSTATESLLRGPKFAREQLPLKQACGRYLDWYSVDPGVPESALAGVEAPVVRPPQTEP
jgi:hypothetical protein